jgi:3D (Asp-Asp-Asp) domain-containing protein
MTFIKLKSAFITKAFDYFTISLLIVILFDLILFPLPPLMASADEGADFSMVAVANTNNTEQVLLNSLPEASDWNVVRTGYYSMTAYNSEAAQCYGDPCITANGFNLCEHNTEDSVAANFLKFGTRIRIPELFGDRVFVVRDRMNSRYQDRVDVWMKEKQDALNFGLKYAKIEILEDIQQ